MLKTMYDLPLNLSYPAFERFLFQLLQALQPQRLCWVSDRLDWLSLAREVLPAESQLDWLSEQDPLALEVPFPAHWRRRASWPRRPASRQEVQAFYVAQRTALNHRPLDQVLLSVDAAQQIATPSGQVVEPQVYDLALLDGPEFLSGQDLDAVYGTQTLVLRGVHSFRHHHSYLRLKHDPAYFVLAENLRAEDGFAIFWKRQALLPGVSAVVHTYQAEKELAACLTSLAWCDEVLVIDMYSTDQTVAIAQAHGARVIRHVAMDCVDEARNFGLSQVRHAWTLVLDADERLPQALISTLQRLILAPEGHAGFWLPRQNIFFGQVIHSLFPDYQLRLFRSMAAHWSGLVHEHPKLDGSNQALPALVDQAIEHHSYPSVAEFMSRQIRYAETFWSQSQHLLNLADQHLSPDLLREQYMRQMQDVMDHVHQHPPNHLEWLTRHLYLFSELAKAARFLEGSGHLRSAPAKPVRISGFSYVKNAVKFDYPFVESLRSVATLCDEIIVTVARDSEDDTWQRLQALRREIPQLKLVLTNVWQNFRPEGGEVIRRACEEALALCSGDWVLHVQADEVYRREDIARMHSLVQQYHAQQVDGFYFKIRHYYASYTQEIGPRGREIGWYQYCIRLMRRDQGVPIQDAWTFQLKDPSPSAVVTTDIWIHHYGHVREQEAMRLKASYMERLYQALPEDYVVSAPGAFQYNRVPAAFLETVKHPHPEAMAVRIARRHLEQLAQGHKPRVLIVTRSPLVQKGYGITMREIYATGILQKHFEIHHLAWHYEGPPFLKDGVQIYPSPEDIPAKNQALRELLYRLNPEVVLLHADAQFFRSHLSELQAWKGPVLGWFTVDYERHQNPDLLLPLLQRCQRIACMADFAMTQTRKNYAGPLGWVPLGVNLEQFEAVTPEGRQQIRESLGLPQQGFLFLMVANNFWRKGIEYAVQSFAELHRRYPQSAQDMILYLHTEANDGLLELISSLNLDGKVFVSKGFDPFRSPLSENQLARLYQAADAFFLPSLGEGFGMPVLEAQACGLPLVISDNSVLREVGGEAALYIRCPGITPGQNAERLVWLRTPDPEHAAQLLYQLYSNRALQQNLRQAGLRQAASAGWERTAYLLGAELAQSLGTGTLEYRPSEPGWKAV
ncbi:MAG: glycosyltransferase [Candidatus Sericytochromatia bacterium]